MNKFWKIVLFISLTDDVFILQDVYVSLESNSVEPMADQISTVNPEELDAKYWRRDAQDYLRDVLKDPIKTLKQTAPKRAKNVILFLGEFMVNHIRLKSIKTTQLVCLQFIDDFFYINFYYS